MDTAARFLITKPRQVLSPYAVNGIAPSAVWDFGAGAYPVGFALGRAAAAYGFDVSGRFVSYPANSLRFDARASLRTAIFEATSSNLLSHAVADPLSGWATNGASASALSLNALGVFKGVTVTSNGAIWHRLNHTAEPAVSNGATYHVRAFFVFGTSGKVLVTLRNQAAGVDSRVEFATSGVSVLGTNAGGLSNATLTSLGVDGAYRLDLDFSANYTGTLSLGIGPDSAATGKTVVLLGAQVESGSLGSTFIRSAGTAATRPTDNVTWNAPVGTWDLRIVTGAGVASDTRNVSVAAGWSPQALPFAPARVLLYPTGTL